MFLIKLLILVLGLYIASKIIANQLNKEDTNVCDPHTCSGFRMMHYIKKNGVDMDITPQACSFYPTCSRGGKNG